MVSSPDLDGDGLRDLLAHFRTEELLLTPTDAEGVVEGETFDHRKIRGVAPVRIRKRLEKALMSSPS